MRRIIRKVLIVLLILLFAIQFVRPARNLGSADGPADLTHFVHTPDSVLHILKDLLLRLSFQSYGLPLVCKYQSGRTMAQKPY